MSNRCLLENERICKGDCDGCGWNPEEANQRGEMVAANELTICEGGIKKLIIKRKASEE